MENIALISEDVIKNIDPILRDPLRITRELFLSSKEVNFQKIISDINHYIQENPLNKETIENILCIFSIVRPKEQELLTKISSAFSISYNSRDKFLNEYLGYNYPFIYTSDSSQYPIIDLIKFDKFNDFQKFISNIPDFNFLEKFTIKHSPYVNLVDIAAYYGSVECFKYLVLNNAPFSEDVCQFSICGGNYEIIHYLENN